MQLKTKFLRLRTPGTLGSRFGDWHVCWLGGWGRHRLYYLVMVVKSSSGRALVAFEKSNIAMTNRGLPKAGVLSGTVRAAK